MSSEVWNCRARDRTTARLTEFMTEWFEEFFEPRYLLVYRTHEFQEPRLGEKYDQPKDGLFGQELVGSFKPGSVSGDVLIYEVATKKLLGGIPYSAKSSGQVSDERVRRDPLYLRTDISRSAAHRVEQALKPYVADR